VLVEDELLSSTSRWVVEGHLFSMCHQPLVSSPAGTPGHVWRGVCGVGGGVTQMGDTMGGTCE
jgi:hypothetical protein